MQSKSMLSLCLVFYSYLLSGCQLEIDLNTGTHITTVPFTVIASGKYPVSGYFENRRLEVFQNQASLDANLAIYVSFVQPYIVNFSTHQAVLINTGERNSGGYSVKTNQVQEFNDHIKIKITLTKPGDGCFTTLALTSPFEFIEVNSTKEIIFEQNLITIDCS